MTIPTVGKILTAMVLDEVSQFLKDEGLSARELARKLGVTHPTILAVQKPQAKNRPLYRYALRGLKEELRAQERAAEGAPTCARCHSPMMKSNKRFHWFYGQLRECWTCRRRCNAGMYGVPLYGASAGKLIRLDRARNPHTGQEVHIPWRHKVSAYEQRHGQVWCDVCGGVLSWERTAKYKTWRATYAVFRCVNRDCKYGRSRQRVYCRAGKVYSHPQRRWTSLPKKAQIHPICGGRVIKRMGKAYPTMNPGRNSHSELVRCRCTKCGKTLYFNLKRGKFESDLPIGGKAVQDANRPHCRKCEAIAHRKAPVRRFALRAGVFRKNPLLAPMPVRLKLERINLKGNQIIAVKYWCPHLVVWKTTDGQVMYEWRRRPGKSPKSRRFGVHYEQYKKRLKAEPAPPAARTIEPEN